MKRYEFEQAVYDSGLDKVSKSVLLWYGFKKNWAKDGLAWGSAQTIAKSTGLGTRSVEDRIPLLVRLGWLVDTGLFAHTGKGRPPRKFNLAIGLSAADAGKCEGTLPNDVRVSGGTSPQKRQDFPAKTEDFTAEMTDFTAPTADEQVYEQDIEHVREQVTTVADAPVVVKEIESKDESNIQVVESSFVNTETHAERVFKESSMPFAQKERFAKALEKILEDDDNEHQVADAWDLMFDTTWKWHAFANEDSRAFAVLEEVGLRTLW